MQNLLKVPENKISYWASVFIMVTQEEVILLNKLERLEQEASDKEIPIHNFDLGTRIKGVYCDGNIALSSRLETTTEKSCVLAEELGHHYTSVGNILDMQNLANRKQERQARLWAYNKQIGLRGLIRSYEHGCQSSHEIADYLEVTEEFFLEAIECYTQKYGTYATLDNYIIYFMPFITVGKRI